MKLAIIALAVSLSTVSAAMAVTTFGTVSPTKANGDFIAGSGNPADNFTIDTAVTGESVALKARDRNTGEAISQIANRYLVPQGMATATRAAWNFDFQFSPGANSTKTATDYTYQIQADTNPAFGLATYQTFNVPADNANPSLPAGDSFFANPGAGAWSDNTTPFVIANSENYNFGFLAGSTFANNGPAEYQLNFTAFDASTGLAVASTTVFAEVVPEPTTLAAIAGTGLVALRRRRRA